MRLPAIHEKENNPQSQAHLEKHRKHFSKQCLLVLELLLRGIKLTTMNAPSYKIRSLPRRIADLREIHGIYVDERWVDNGDSPETKEWFIELRTDNEKKELQQWFSQYQNEQPPTPKLKPLEQINLF